MKYGLALFSSFFFLLAVFADEAEVSLDIELSKTEIHHLEPVTVRLKVTNHGKKDFVMKSTMVCSQNDMQISFSDACTESTEHCLGGAVIIPANKTQELLMPDRVFGPGNHKIFVIMSCPEFKSIKSNEIPVRVRKATKEEAMMWSKECYEIYEKMKDARKSGDREAFFIMKNLLFGRLEHEELFSIPIVTRVLDDGVIDYENMLGAVHMMNIRICRNQKDKEFVEKNIDLKPVISLMLKMINEKDEAKILEMSLLGYNLMPWMSDDDKNEYRESLKEFIYNHKHKGTHPVALAATMLIANFPDECEMLEKAMQSPGFVGDMDRENLKTALQNVKSKIKKTGK